MKVLSLFSGVGGFDLGLEAAGMETVAMCEWDKKAASVLRRHWPQIPIYGDVSDLTGAQLLADRVLPDLVAFGSPCQDLSVAGKRAGLAGERSGLFHEAVRIIRELRALTDGALPRWIIWENVVGALNSNGGADFQAVLNQMGDIGACFSEWAVLDAQNYGVPQRRRRVFLVSCLDPGAARECPGPLLPIGKGRPRDLVPLRQAWKDSPAGARGRSPGTIARAQVFRKGSFGTYVETAEAGTLRAAGGDLGGGSESLCATSYTVRRLLPIECERLMGWPDDWTRWDAEGKEQADSHRYKQTGNGVASPVAEWVGRQIFAADARRHL